MSDRLISIQVTSPCAAAEDMETIFNRVLEQIQSLSVGEGAEHAYLSATIGVAAGQPSEICLTEPISRADTALLQAKRAGGGQVLGFREHEN